MFGYVAETLKQKAWQELTAQDYRDADLKNVNDVLEGRIDSYRMVKQYIHADGHPIWGDLSVSCIRDKEGRVEDLIAQITDITAEVETRQQLQQQNERNRLLAKRLQRQSDQMKTELVSAAAYMSSIMPRGLAGAVRVSSRYLPSRELGGDCFDYTWIDDDHLLVYLIDVSGHGVEPALLSVSLLNMLRSGSLSAATLLAPETVLAELNRLFQMHQQNDHYFTMWLGVYEATSRTLRYASAGHPPVFAFDSPTGEAAALTELSPISAPVGIFEDTVFTSLTYPVPPGCRVLLYSDGANELALADDRQLTSEEFKGVCTQVASSPNWSLDELIEALRDLSPSGAFEDDCSLIQLTFD